jgi:hypothetical protein
MLYQFAYLNFIDPGFIDKSLEIAYNDMLGQGLSEAQINMSMQYTKMFMTPTMLSIFSIVGTVFTGAFLGLITSAFAMKAQTNRGF